MRREGPGTPRGDVPKKATTVARRSPPPRREAPDDDTEARRLDKALAMWNAATPADDGSIVATYLRSRGIVLPGGIPATLRALASPPAMIAAVGMARETEPGWIGVAKGGPPGHTSLAGADDAQIAVMKAESGLATATVEHMKDGQSGAVMRFRLDPVELGIDEDGEPITSLVRSGPTTRPPPPSRGRN